MSVSRYTTRLRKLGFELPDWCSEPSEDAVQEYEARFSLRLPTDYREFLAHHGGVVGDAECPFLELTPCGRATTVDNFYGFTKKGRTDNVGEMTELIDGAPDVVAIADNLLGAMFWLKCTGTDAGYGYMHDHEGRSAWPDETFHSMFSNLDPGIQHYLDLRREGKLPVKRVGYEHVYLVGKSFEQFLYSLIPVAE